MAPMKAGKIVLRVFQEIMILNLRLGFLKIVLKFLSIKVYISDLRLLQEFPVYRETSRNAASILEFDVLDQTTMVHHQESVYLFSLVGLADRNLGNPSLDSSILVTSPRNLFCFVLRNYATMNS
jgi:hypothetical protein